MKPWEELQRYMDDNSIPASQAHIFIEQKAKEYPPFTNFGLNKVPHSLMPAIAICMEEYAADKTHELRVALKECAEVLQWHLNKSRPQIEDDQSDFFNSTANAITQAETLLQLIQK